MTTQVEVTEDITEIIQDIIAKENLDPHSHITYSEGFEAGDGYMSRTICVVIEGLRPLYLFLKCGIVMKNTEMSLNIIYANEINFYDVINPKYVKFEGDHCIEDGFRNVPKCYGTSTKHIIALEDLRQRGYTLFDRKSVMDDNHIVLVLKAYAKFHAISFAYKDQRKDEFETIAAKVQGMFKDPSLKSEMMYDWQRQMINGCIDKWDPVEDENLLNKIGNLADNLVNKLRNVFDKHDEHSVITKGDCWSNNMMFLYEKENKENPIDVMLIDWQLVNFGSVVLDISYFFYTVASEETLKNHDYYLKLYHEELCKHIRLLGSDPEILYPYSLLEAEWKAHSNYGYTMAFLIIQAMLIPKEDAPNMAEIDFNDIPKMELFKLKNEDEYLRRMKILTEHMLENSYLNF